MSRKGILVGLGITAIIGVVLAWHFLCMRTIEVPALKGPYTVFRFSGTTKETLVVGDAAEARVRAALAILEQHDHGWSVDFVSRSNSDCVNVVGSNFGLHLWGNGRVVLVQTHAKVGPLTKIITNVADMLAVLERQAPTVQVP